MLLGHNWVTNGPFLERHVYYKSDIGISDYMAQESGRKWVNAEGATTTRKYHLRQTSADFGQKGGEMKVKGGKMTEIGEMIPHRYKTVTEFEAQSNRSIHRKVREERKAPPHKPMHLEEIPLPGTRISRIKRIDTDNTIRAYPRQPLRQLTSPTRMGVAKRGDQCSIENNLKGKISYQWLFYPVIEQGVAQ